MPSSVMKYAAVLSLLGIVFGARHQEAELRTDEDLDAEAQFGSIVAGRFEMHHALWQQDLDTRLIKHIPLPKNVNARFHKAKELFAGSFGEAWAATDKKSGKKVVVKMFYTGQGHGRKFISWKSAMSNSELKTQLEDAAGECEVARSMQSYAESDPTGASRLMQCYEDHVTQGTSITGHKVSKSEPLFQVLEDCGGLPLGKWFQKQAKAGKVRADPTAYMYTAVHLFKQMMEGLNYLTHPKHKNKWVHHDLKPDNAVVKELGDGNVVLKIIDFGSVTRVNPATANTPLVSTVVYAPPEWFPVARGYDAKNPWSFDTYQAATILDELVTGKMTYDKLAVHAKKPTQVELTMCINNQRRQQGIYTPAYSPYGVRKDAAYLQLQAACATNIGMENTKGKNGYEKKLTKNWGKAVNKKVTTYQTKQVTRRQTRYPYGYTTVNVKQPTTSYKKQSWEAAALEEIPKLEKILFGSGSVSAEFSQVAAAYKARAKQKNWYPSFMTMLAHDSGARATPQQILDHDFINSIPHVADPDFDAKAAQESSKPVKSKQVPNLGYVRPLNNGQNVRVLGTVKINKGKSPAVVMCPWQRIITPGAKIYMCVKTPYGHRIVN